MPDILVRGLSEAAVRHFDSEARHLGVSRAEVLRRHLEADVALEERPARTMTADDWEAFATGFSGLADPEVMGAAWR